MQMSDRMRLLGRGWKESLTGAVRKTSGYAGGYLFVFPAFCYPSLKILCRIYIG